MVTQSENELLTRVEGDAPMGRLLREYWVPIMRGVRVQPGGAPISFRMFGDNFVAYRGHSGKVGILDARCPHRGASMVLARNEDDCLRCVFHGWKFTADGECVDVPNERSERSGFRENIRTGGYATHEAAGVVWGYFGVHQAQPPKFPDFVFNTLPDGHCITYSGPINCNWLQAVEPALDNSHATILHTNTNLKLMTGHLANAKLDLAPLYDVDLQNYGLRAAAVRRRPDGKKYVRVIEYIMPYFAFVPSEPNGDQLMLAATPVDDTHSVQWYFIFNPNREVTYDGPRAQGFDARWWALGEQYAQFNPDNFRETVPESEPWGQDRAAMAGGSFTGLDPLIFEDLAVQESQGAIADRTREHLGVADAAVARLRRFLLKALDEHQQGEAPRGFDEPFPYEDIIGTSYILEADEDWRKFFVPGASKVQREMPAPAK